MNEEDAINELIAELVDSGALVIDGMFGEEFTYKVNVEKMKAEFPEFYDIYMQDVEQTMLDLVEQGLVSIEYDENLKALFSLTEEGHAVAEQIMLGNYLPPDDV